MFTVLVVPKRNPPARTRSTRQQIFFITTSYNTNREVMHEEQQVNLVHPHPARHNSMIKSAFTLHNKIQIQQPNKKKYILYTKKVQKLT